MEANKKEQCDFSVTYNGEQWDIEEVWIQANGEVAWYAGSMYRNGVKFMRIFLPSEIDVPLVTTIHESWMAKEVMRLYTPEMLDTESIV